MGEIESALDLILKNQAGAVQNLSAKATEDTDGEAVPSPAPTPTFSKLQLLVNWKSACQQLRLSQNTILFGVFWICLSCSTPLTHTSMQWTANWVKL